jgi:hypothetical protein
MLALALGLGRSSGHLHYIWCWEAMVGKEAVAQEGEECIVKIWVCMLGPHQPTTNMLLWCLELIKASLDQWWHGHEF